MSSQTSNAVSDNENVVTTYISEMNEKISFTNIQQQSKLVSEKFQVAEIDAFW